MILIHREPFGMSSYWKKHHGGIAAPEEMKGPILRGRVRFAHWLDGKETEADIFVDPGADATILSWRWTALAFDQHRSSTRLSMKKRDFIGEDLFLHVGRRWLKVPRTEVGPRILSQPGKMPGYDDILLGRDFLDAHGILTVIDGEARQLSLLLPDDNDNRARRDQILGALDPGSPVGRGA